MNSRKNLAAKVAGAMAIAALMGTSAFAESRHFDATERDHGRQSSNDRASRHERRDRSGSQNQTQERRDWLHAHRKAAKRNTQMRNRLQSYLSDNGVRLKKDTPLAKDPDIMKRSGGTWIAAEVAHDYGVTDIDGKVVPSLRATHGEVSDVLRAT